MNADEIRAVKAWLRQLREARGYTQEALAGAIGVDRRTILNAESEKAGFPNGMTMLRLLRELGGLPLEAPVGPPREIRTLESVEERMASGFEEIHAAIESLSADVEGLAARLPGRGAQTK